MNQDFTKNNKIILSPKKDQKILKEISVELEGSYGRTLFKPICEQGKILMKMKRGTTWDFDDLCFLKSIGFTILISGLSDRQYEKLCTEDVD